MSIKRNRNSRRRFIKRSAGACGFLLSGAIMWGACDKRNSNTQAQQEALIDPCTDMRAISKEDLAVREKLGYTEKSPLPDNQCNNCNLYLPSKDELPCGGCMLFKGPVFGTAYCTYWAPKV